MEQQIVSKFMESGIVGIMLLGATYLIVKFYIEDKNQAKQDRERDRQQILDQITHYRGESKEQRELFMNSMNKFHTQMDKFGDALNANNTQIQLLNENLKDMELKVDNIQQELSTIKSSNAKQGGI